MNERDLFLSALEIEDPAARHAHLQSACAGNGELLTLVESLLASHEGKSQFLQTPVVEQLGEEPAGQTAATLVIGTGSTHDESPGESPNASILEFSPNQERIKMADEIPLGYLEPSTKPGSLGRLAHYEILEVVGQGAFGTVLRAFDEKLQRVVAIKVMAPELAATSPARKRFIREAQASAQIRHENVVSVYAVEEKPIPYLVMEYIPGVTLQQRLDERGPLEILTVLRLGRQIAEGLAAAHAKDLIHRDIKPGNILLETGVQDRVKITDFGLARAADDASMSQSGVIAGTPMYMAPEQALGHKLDQRADLFSFGSVLYQMASGRPPFRASSTLAVLKRLTEDTPRPIREIIPETPAWLCDIITKLHAKNPDERYQSAREIAEVLANCEAQLKEHSRLKDLSLIPRATTQPVGWWKWVAAAAVVLPLLAIGLYAATRPGSEPKVAGNDTVEPPIPDPIKPVATEKSSPATIPVVPVTNGWVQLFNGQDLTGWTTGNPNLWRVRDGILVGQGSMGYLATSRGDFRDFHLRAEVKASDGSDSGIFFRGSFANDQRHAYEADISLTTVRHHTGSLMKFPSRNWLLKPETRQLLKNDTWCQLEVNAVGGHLIVKVDGVTTAELDDGEFSQGHIGLQLSKDATSHVEFRKIEIKELPARPTLSEGFVSLFNGKDLTGWKPDPLAPGKWCVEDGAIVGQGGISLLLSESGDYANFHLRAEVKINATGDSGICFRLPHEGRPDNPPGQPAVPGAYEAQIAVRSNYAVHTGSVMIDVDPARAPLVHKAPLMPHGPDQWFVLEVIAEGNRIQTRVNGKPAADYRDDEHRYSQGRLGLHTWGANITFVQFRKIEIKKLPPVPVAKQEPLPPTFTNSLGMEFVLVPKGKSWLGGGKDKLGDKEVDIPADFYLGKYEVTQEEWEKVMGENPSHFSRTGEGKDAVKDVSDVDLKLFPVEMVSWDQIQSFVAKLNTLAKETEWVYRLPTEKEWEYACRGGPTADKAESAFDFYFAKPTNTLLPEQANFNESGLNRTCKVGSYKPNELGLYDMHGNVWDWCDDLFDPKGSDRVSRCGGWRNVAVDCVAMRRSWPSSGLRSPDLGFRLARVPVGAPSTEAKTPPLAVAPFTDADVKRIAALPAEQQVEEVRKELMRRNPGFDGEIESKIHDGIATEIKVVPDKVTDISPVRVWSGLRVLDCGGTWNQNSNGQLAELAPLEGMNLERLNLTDTKVTDAEMACLKDCKRLTALFLLRTQIGDAGLVHLQDCKDLAVLRLDATRVTDAGLAHLKGCKALTELILPYTQLSGAGLEHLKDCKNLIHLHIDQTSVGDAGFAHVKGMPLKKLSIESTGITDLTPLQGVPLEKIHLTPKNITKGLAILRDMKSLKTIGIDWTKSWPAAEFWDRYEKGEFKE